MFTLVVLLELLVASWPQSGCAKQPVVRATTPEASRSTPQNFGIDETWKPNGEKLTLNGMRISKERAKEILSRPTLEDDSNKLRLTIIGPEAERKRVLDDLNGPLATLAKDFVIQSYEPTNWAVARYGFVCSGAPTIYAQAPDGKVLHRQDDYRDGASGLQRALEAIRKADPSYEPAKDPDLRKAPAGKAPTWLLIAFAVVAWMMFNKSKPKQ